MAKHHERGIILGGGVTGLAAGMASGLPVFEARDLPGGICSSYFVSAKTGEVLPAPPRTGDAYRFEVGGGHWIFGGDPLVTRLLDDLSPMKRYVRKASIYFPDTELLVPYPIQANLRYLGADVAATALTEMIEAARRNAPIATMADWLQASFGPTLCGMFFEPFHELYTAGLWRSIAPQDAYKSPVLMREAVRGAFAEVPAIGYNVTFAYPASGLDDLAQAMASRCTMHYGREAVRVDVERREVHFSDGTTVAYGFLLSTLPLNRMIRLAGLSTGTRPDPAVSVLVMNIGAYRGPRCPQDHWVYLPKSRTGVHRVGFYSNVDPGFLPDHPRSGERVSLYVEKAYREGERPTADAVTSLGQGIAEELRDWGWITDVEVIHPTWIDVAYTWSWPGSAWRQEALQLLERHPIHQVGRFARWIFQGIADSIRDGLFAGAAVRLWR